MTTALLALALLAQLPAGDLDGAPAPEPSPPSAADVARLDLGFAWAQEDSIAREPGATLPDPAYAGLVGLLGCDAYRGREDATTRLESAIRRDPAALRWLFWGRRHRDPEVRSRCNALVRRLTPAPACGTCRGTGLFYDGECWSCKGLRHLWIYTPWD